MQILLTPELERLIQEKVSSGRYASAIEVIGESLKLLDERDRAIGTRLIELKQKIQIGIDELDQGLGIDGDDVFAEIETEIQQAEAQIHVAEESA